MSPVTTEDACLLLLHSMPSGLCQVWRVEIMGNISIMYVVTLGLTGMSQYAHRHACHRPSMYGRDFNNDNPDMGETVLVR